MTDSEKQAMMASDDGRGTAFIYQLQELDTLAKQEGVLSLLGDVIAHLKGKADHDEDDEDQNDADDDEDEDKDEES
jgi:hypothetical protein